MLSYLMGYFSTLFFVYYTVVLYLLITYVLKSENYDYRVSVKNNLTFLYIQACFLHFVEFTKAAFVYFVEFFNIHWSSYTATYLALGIKRGVDPFQTLFLNYDALYFYVNGWYRRSLLSKFILDITRYFYVFCQTILLFYFNYLWYYYDSNFLGFQYFKIFYVAVDFFNFSRIMPVYLGIDSLSLLLLILTCFICPLVILNSNKLFGSKYTPEQSVLFVLLICLIQLILILSFIVLDAFIFFILFEFILVPTFILIIVFGSNSKKIRAAYYLVMYTLFTSIFFLASILWIMFCGGSFSYFLFSFIFDLDSSVSITIWFLLFISLICKVPTFPFFIWLPEAHVEAPTAGSVILASLLLKLGGYGILRYLLPFFKYGTYYFLPITYTLFTISFLLASFYALESADIKKVIAYSSISHMNFALLGLFSGTIFGIQGSILFFIGHGFVSAALFFLVGFIYDRFGTRYITYYGGLLFVMPNFSALFLFFTLANLSFPGTINFIAEFLIICSLFFSSKLTLIPVFILGFLTSVYSLWLYAKLCLGPVTSYKFDCVDLVDSELCVVLPLAFFTFYFGFFPGSVLDCCFINFLYIY